MKKDAYPFSVLKGRLSALASVAILVALTGGAAGLSLVTSPAATLSSAQLIGPPPPGFTSERTEAQTGRTTGIQTFSGAASFDCNPAFLTTGRKSWVASELRYFDKDARYRSIYLEICVSQLKSPTYARTNASNDAQLMRLIIVPPHTFAVPGVPNAAGILLGGSGAGNFLEEIIFYKGSYCTVIATQGSNDGLVEIARGLAINLAVVEYRRLPM